MSAVLVPPARVEHESSSMIDRVRNLRARIRPTSSSASPTRRMTRRQREERQRRLAVYGIIVAGVLVVIILGTGALYQYVYLPNKTLASVNSTKITMSEYWKYRKYGLINEINQYSQFAQYAQGQNAQQYQSLVDQARLQLQTVEQDPPDADTLNTMVEDQVILQNYT